ncbi:hypothetical protein [Pyxidicoccus fallax]|uniref:Uncharacterized protein n=1 Tax=Pyxidicoccus fallax TaxID=394095 RepID=A0A848LZZ7_9BACT|nr:hypothetical protein [Pyxidicoccus fallax]NMO23675.1 hypothetical protein [Pyxidicoccus fallax]
MPFEKPIEATVGKHTLRLENPEAKLKKVTTIEVTANGPNVFKLKWDEP